MVFSTKWKKSYITTFFFFFLRIKENIENYKSICNRSVMGKLFDSLAYDQINFSYCNMLS